MLLGKLCSLYSFPRQVFPVFLASCVIGNHLSCCCSNSLILICIAASSEQHRRRSNDNAAPRAAAAAGMVLAGRDGTGRVCRAGAGHWAGRPAQSTRGTLSPSTNARQRFPASHQHGVTLIVPENSRNE